MGLDQLNGMEGCSAHGCIPMLQLWADLCTKAAENHLRRCAGSLLLERHRPLSEA